MTIIGPWQEKTSKIKLSGQLFAVDNSLKFRAQPWVDIMIDCTNAHVHIEFVNSDGDASGAYKLAKGDTMRLRHKINIEYVSSVSETLPLEIKFHGETYTLDQTKNKKLIITK